MQREEEVYDTLLESISSYYNAIANPKRLKILFELKENFIEGMKWAALKELSGLTSGALKRHMDILLEQELIGKFKSNYRITESGLGLLTQIEQIFDAMGEILDQRKKES